MFTDNNAVSTRQPVSCYLVVDGADRNDANSVLNNTLTVADIQPWNDFKIQKPAPLLDGYNKRIAMTEINFAWSIPNISGRNNSFYIAGAGMPSGAYRVVVSPGFYTGAELVSAINADLSANVVNPPVFSWSTSQLAITITPDVSNNNLTIYTTTATDEYSTYAFKASLVKTMGFAFAQLNTTFTAVAPLVGSTTKLLYTAFVDVVSSKLNYNSDIKDGSSARKNVSDVISRVYCADETSSGANLLQAGQRPFQIHRQMIVPKYMKLNPNQMLDWIDIQVFDEFGDLVYLPGGVRTYPDFQMTFIASEA